MTTLAIAVAGAAVDPTALSPTINLGLGVEEVNGGRVETLLLRAQVRIDPRQRTYAPPEGDRLLGLWGSPDRWGDTQSSLVWAHVERTVPAFEGSTRVDLPLPCTYDTDVAAASYLAALDGGEIPLVVLFSGTAFAQDQEGRLRVSPVPWTLEARWDLPVATWREAMDRHFPGCTWLRLPRESYWALARYKAERALPTWEAVVDDVLTRARAEDRA